MCWNSVCFCEEDVFDGLYKCAMAGVWTLRCGVRRMFFTLDEEECFAADLVYV